jgi:uncharacterized protein (DUF433 family)
VPACRYADPKFTRLSNEARLGKTKDILHVYPSTLPFRSGKIILLSLYHKLSNPITISPNIQSGEPVFTNTRVPVKNLFDYLKAGHSLNVFLEDFPSVKKEQTIQVINHFENLLNFQAIADEKGTA